jgi:acyl-coenzyme A thioesterase PaaI-like protein
MPLVHHELCFGCGRTNLFGLLIDVQRTARNEVAGRCFVKQDHQGAQVGLAHDGIIAAALAEAMSLAAASEDAPVRTLATLAVSFESTATAPVGAFIELTAQADGAGAATATARSESELLATASATYS